MPRPHPDNYVDHPVTYGAEGHDWDLTVEVSVTSAQQRDRSVTYQEMPYGSVPWIPPLSVDANDVAAQVSGIKKRLAQPLPHADPDVWQDIGHFVDRLCERIPVLDHLTTFEEWLSTREAYNEARKKELADKFARLMGHAPNRAQRRSVASFIKREAYMEWKQARWINSRSDYFKVYSGPAFASMEKVIYDLDLFGLGHSNFIKHVPVPDRPQVIQDTLLKSGCRYYGTDYTAFESHFLPALMKAVECRIYKHMLKNFPDVARVICGTLTGKNCGYTRSGVRFTCQARRMSGDMCTSLGNGLTNLILWAYLCEKKGIHWDGYVEGDDGIFRTDGPAPTVEDFAGVGMTIKMESAEDPADLSFCGCVYAGGAILRNPVSFVQSFGWSASHIGCSEKVLNELLRAKAMSAISELGGCPVNSVIAKRALQLTEGSKARFVLDGYHTQQPDATLIQRQLARPITTEARLKFADLYGVSIEQQEQMERDILAGVPLSEALASLSRPESFVDFESRYVQVG